MMRHSVGKKGGRREDTYGAISVDSRADVRLAVARRGDAGRVRNGEVRASALGRLRERRCCEDWR
jgi:hypothetical protein